MFTFFDEYFLYLCYSYYVVDTTPGALGRQQ